jgi:hypothetical protein
MYYMTGLPGWMRFGYSPGWAGRSASGFGPCAEYMMTGQWPTPQMQMAMQGYPMAAMGYPGMMAPDAEAMKQQQLAMLQQQAEFIEYQLEQVNAQIAQLEQADQ